MRLFGQLPVRNIVHDALPEERLAGLIADEHRFIAHPQHTPVTLQQAVFDAERLAGLAGTLVFGVTWNQDSGGDTPTGIPNNQQSGNGWTISAQKLKEPVHSEGK